jgi:hypothetical protein
MGRAGNRKRIYHGPPSIEMQEEERVDVYQSKHWCLACPMYEYGTLNNQRGHRDSGRPLSIVRGRQSTGNQ